MKDFGDAFDDMIKNTSWKSKFYKANLNDDWEKIFGNLIAKYTDSLTLTGQKLYIKVSSAPLRHELFNSRDKIIFQINSYYKAEIVKEIILR